MGNALTAAIRENQPPSVLDEIIRDNPRLLRRQDRYGAVPLHHAVHARAPLEVIRLLVDEYPDALLVQAHLGWLPLHVAALVAPLEVVQLLAEACPESLLVKEKNGQLPLHIAAANNASLEVIQYLVEKRPDALLIEQKIGWLPLHHAAYHKASLEVVQCLADRGPEALLAATRRGAVPLHYAAMTSSLEVVRYLTNKSPEALLVRSNAGRLPVDAAREFNEDHPDVAAWLEAATSDRLKDRDRGSIGRIPPAAALRGPVPDPKGHGRDQADDRLDLPQPSFAAGKRKQA